LADSQKPPPAAAASGNMGDMKTPLALLGLVVCTLPLLAQQPARRVVAPCELTTSSLTPSSSEKPTKVGEFTVLVRNDSARTLALPRSPLFGWRVDVAARNGWKLKAEGGPVRRIEAKDPHIVVVGPSGSEPMEELPPAASRTFIVNLPEAAEAFHPSRGKSSLRLTLYWAATAELARLNPAVPACGLAPQLVVNAVRP